MKTSKTTSTTTSTATANSTATSTTTSCLAATVLSIFLTACGGSSAPTDGAVSGTVSGLGTGLSLALQNNGADTVTVAANGTFAFPTKLPSLGPFSITVLTQPVGQTCTVTRPTGVIPTDGNQANTTTVACVANSLGATVSGLTAGSAVTLSNAGVQLVVNANGVATFPGILVGGTAYAVTVAVQPAGQVCTLSSASGAITTGIQSLARLNCV
jgi:hypothetical protein